MLENMIIQRGGTTQWYTPPEGQPVRPRAAQIHANQNLLVSVHPPEKKRSARLCRMHVQWHLRVPRVAGPSLPIPVKADCRTSQQWSPGGVLFTARRQASGRARAATIGPGFRSARVFHAIAAFLKRVESGRCLADPTLLGIPGLTVPPDLRAPNGRLGRRQSEAFQRALPLLLLFGITRLGLLFQRIPSTHKIA